MLTKLRERLQFWINSAAGVANAIGLTPNQLSGLGLVFAILSALAYYQHQRYPPLLVLAPILLLASGLCDVLDGALARSYGMVTPIGGFLDSLLDRYGDAVLIGGVILSGLCDTTWGIIALVGAMLVSYTRARAEAEGVTMEEVGIAERAERLLLLALAGFLQTIWTEALRWGMIVLAILTHVTVAQRAIYFRRASLHKRS